MEAKDLRLVLKIKPKFIEVVKRRKLTECCSTYCVVNSRGEWEDLPHQYCYRSIADYGNGCKAAILWLSRKLYDYETNEQDSILYLDWLLNRSPWQEAFVTRNAKKAYHQRIVVLNTDAPANIMVGGAVGVRRLWETERIIRTWVDLSKAGVQQDLAYYLACVARKSGDKVCWTGVEQGHENLAVGYWGQDDLLAFLSHKPVGAYKSFRVRPQSMGFSRLWGGDGKGRSINTFINENFLVEAKVEAKPSANPFAKAIVHDRVDKTYKPYEQAINAWVDFQHELFKFVGFGGEVIKPDNIVPFVKQPKVFKRDAQGRFCA